MGRKQRHLTPEEMAEILQNTMVEEEPTLWDSFKQLCRWILMIIIGIIGIMVAAFCIGNKNTSSPAKPATVSTEFEKVKTPTSSSDATKNVIAPQVAPKAKTPIKLETTSNKSFEQKIVDEAIEKEEKQHTTQIQNYNSVESTSETTSNKDAKQQAKAQRKAEKEQRRAERKAKQQANSREE
ncbi:MAG: hypothetical protein K2K43_05440 [Alistipes sp.]|nr:hypothetical protein [Alistipes sp.]